MIAQASWPGLAGRVSGLSSGLSLPTPLFPVMASQALGEVTGVWEDLQELAGKAPQALSQIVVIVKKAGKHLPTIVKIVEKAGDQIPNILKVVEKVGPQLPTVIRVIDKIAPRLPEVVKIIDKAEPYFPTIVAVMEDPALPAIIDRVKTIQALEQTAAAKKPTPPVVPGTTPAPIGIGLKRVVPGLDAYIYIRKHPWIPWVAGGGAILLLFGIGFGVGRLTGRRREAKAVAGALHYRRRRLIDGEAE